MKKPYKLEKGDKVAIVSLSSGILGEKFCEHQVKLGVKRLKKFGLEPVFMENALKGIEFLKNNPEARAKDLKQAFYDDSIKAIICAIGGDDTFKILPYIIEDNEFIDKVKTTPKIFTGFSDTTNNHLMFYKLGMTSFYGPNFLSDLAELDIKMLEYTKNTFNQFFNNSDSYKIFSSPVWYEEREDFSINALNTPKIAHKETKGYEVLYGNGIIIGKLLGGCLESLYDAYLGDRYPEQKEMYLKYDLLPKLEDWKDKILFIETSEERPKPYLYKKYLDSLDRLGILSVIKAVLVGKPQNEVYYEEYKEILKNYAIKYDLPILYNLNFGHSYPRTLLPYGLSVKIDFDNKTVLINEPMFKKEKQ